MSQNSLSLSLKVRTKNENTSQSLSVKLNIKKNTKLYPAAKTVLQVKLCHNISGQVYTGVNC